MLVIKLLYELIVDVGWRVVLMILMYFGVLGYGVGEEGGLKCGLEE